MGLHLARLVAAACIGTLGCAAVARAQMTDPFKELEGARRDRIELDKRLAHEAAARRRKEEADRAAQALAQRRLDGVVVAPAISPPPGPALGQSASSPMPEAAAGGPASPSATASAPATPLPSDQPGAAPTREGVPGALPSPASVSAAPLPSDQAGVAPTREGAPGALPSPAPDAAPPSGPPADVPGAPARPVAAAPPPPPPPRILIAVDKAAQRMRVSVDGNLRHTWPVSTGRAQYETPAGTFRPLRLAREHYSREWDDAPMPYSIFFTSAGHAIHASNDTRRLGRRASHGCVRLAPAKAAALFALVRAHGAGATKVTITEGAPVRVARRSASR